MRLAAAVDDMLANAEERQLIFVGAWPTPLPVVRVARTVRPISWPSSDRAFVLMICLVASRPSRSLAHCVWLGRQ